MSGKVLKSALFEEDGTTPLTTLAVPPAHTHAPSDVTGTAVVTADARLSDARTPTAHAASHVSGADQIGTFGTAARGLVPASGGGTTNFLRADGSFAAPPAGGGLTGSAATPATTGTMSVNLTTAVVTITPTGACTFNTATAGTIGDIVTFHVTTSGVSSFVLTFGTGFRKVGTLATGTVSARFFSVTFRCVASGVWSEIARTAAQT